MIKENKFFLKNLSSVVFLGQSMEFPELIKINKSLNLETLIVTSSHQSKLIDKKIKYKVFDKLDSRFEKFINNKVKKENTIFISLGARYIFKENMIKNFFSDNLINFHGSRLPLDAGGGGFSWRIMREDRIDNQLVHLIDGGIDTGLIIDNSLSLFPKQCQIPKDFLDHSRKKFLEFYSEFLKKIKIGKSFKLKPQLNYLSRYNPRLNTDTDGLINWEMNSYDLYNFINAFDEPYTGASTYLNNGNFGKLHLKKVHLHGGDSSNHPFMSGLVSRHDGNWIVVSTKSKHMLIVEEVINEKGKNIIKNIKVGDRFYTPLREIELSLSKRTVFNSKGLKK